jgi:hypothetical protein
MIWGNDFSFEDYCMDGDGIVATLSCSKCPTTADFYQRLDEDEEE